MKNTKIFAIASMSLALGLIACQKGGGNSGPTSGLGQRPPLNTQPTNMQRPGQQTNHTQDSVADEIVFPTDKGNLPYNPADFTHVANPNVVPNLTGYSERQDLYYSDAGNDRLMDYLRSKLVGIKDAGNTQGTGAQQLDSKSQQGQQQQQPTGRSEDLELARNIMDAYIVRDSGNLELHIAIVNKGELIYTSKYPVTGEENTRKTVNMEMEPEDEYSREFKPILTCVARTRLSTIQTPDNDACQTVIVRITQIATNADAYVVVRDTPAKIFLHEYTSRLLSNFQGDQIIDRWRDLFLELKTYNNPQLSQDVHNPAKLKSFAVINGISGFSVTFDSYGGAFIASGTLETTKTGGQKVNLPLDLGPRIGIDATNNISESIKQATLVRNNGRGMLTVSLQLHSLMSENTGSAKSGVFFHEKGTQQRSILNPNDLMRRNIAYRMQALTHRYNSTRLQAAPNRTLTFTVVPSLVNSMEIGL